MRNGKLGGEGKRLSLKKLSSKKLSFKKLLFKKVISIALAVALIITSVPPKEVEASGVSDFFG
ncbi:MAG: hypothetical protein LBB44_01120, partial [Endomicrobium sp.]|nr:hypothetical protein [Endomicrobium sp.]